VWDDGQDNEAWREVRGYGQSQVDDLAQRIRIMELGEEGEVLQSISLPMKNR